jgi:signal transduction histidine kinase
VVYGVVHAHGGDIAVQSRLGAGTTFTITLPRRRDVLAPPADQRAEKEPEVTP